ncbi:MAG: VCBS repeat-containing protein [Caldilineaceae bacterium]
MRLCNIRFLSVPRRRQRLLLLLLVWLTISHQLPIGGQTPTVQGATGALPAPVLKWQQGGCYGSWCETGWYSSPAVADLDGNGTMEVIASAYSIVALDGATGALRWRIRSGHDRSENPDVVKDVGRTWPGIIIADVDGNGDPEIVTAHGGGVVSVYNQDGYFAEGWPQKPINNEIRGLSVSDLDGDGSLEVLATGALGSKTNAWVFEHTGTLRTGWPQLSNDTGYAWGVYNDNAAIADLDADGAGEIVIPSDVHYICAYEANGVQLPANAIYGNKAWGKVGVHVDHAVDLRGYANCGEEHRPNFANSPATIADVDGNGTLEIIVVGNVYNCGADPYMDLYEMPFLFNRDRTRWQGDGFDWTAIPAPDDQAAPLSEDYNVIENSRPNPVAADLDGDGKLEILYPSYDGRVHAYWLDKTEHGQWPYAVTEPGEGFLRFAGEPAVADLDNNGRAEVIFASWVQKGTNATGKLHILDDQGNVLHELALPPAFGGGDWNGALAAPTLANIDSDADLEVVLNTAHAGFVAYDLPDTANARILWGTGRGSQSRNGVTPAAATPAPTPTSTTPTVTPTTMPGETPTPIATAPPTGNSNRVLLPVIRKR